MSQYKLNDEQRKLVEDNHGLIYKYMKINHLSPEETTDWYGILACALCKAARVYDESLGSFSTIAFLCMHSEVRSEFRRKKREIKTISLDEVYSHDGKPDESKKVMNMIYDKVNTFEEFELADALKRAMKELSDKEKDIALRKFSGETENNIADEYGVSRQCISKIYLRAKDKIANNLKEVYYF